ncbi:retrovirus-related pol polyprotein from transposon TNT 1-94, partial [Tanacetum coccineum]
FVSYNPPSHDEIELSTTALEPSNVQNFHQVQPSTHIWTKDHPLDHVIDDPSKPVMTRQRLYTDSEVCMYALTVSTIEPKNIKKAMADHSWIESMQDELNQFERLQVWELVPRPEGKNIIALKWLWKNKLITMAQQHASEVHPDELCPPNKRYDLMDANKKVDLEHDIHQVKTLSSAAMAKLCMIFSQMLNNSELLWEDFTILLPSNISNALSIRFIQKIIISLYMTLFLHDILKTIVSYSFCARDMYHNLQDDDIMKNIFDSGRYKDKVGMQIPDWMKHTEHYRMYAEVFGLDVPLTQSQLTDSTQGTHRTPCAPRSPNPKMDEAKSSAPKRSTVIRFHLPERRSTRLTPSAPVPIVDKAYEMILQDTLQISLAEHKGREEQEAREIVNWSQALGLNEEERSPSTLGNQEQVDDYDFWTDSYASDDDEIPMKQVSQDIMEEVSLTIDEAKLKKMVTLFGKVKKEILVSPHPQKTTPLVQSFQRDPEAPTLSIINQDLLYLKKGSSGPEKIVLSLYKFPTIIFNDDDIEERTSR